MYENSCYKMDSTKKDLSSNHSPTSESRENSTHSENRTRRSGVHTTSNPLTMQLVASLSNSPLDSHSGSSTGSPFRTRANSVPGNRSRKSSRADSHSTLDDIDEHGVGFRSRLDSNTSDVMFHLESDDHDDISGITMMQTSRDDTPFGTYQDEDKGQISDGLANSPRLQDDNLSGSPRSSPFKAKRRMSLSNLRNSIKTKHVVSNDAEPSTSLPKSKTESKTLIGRVQNKLQRSFRVKKSRTTNDFKGLAQEDNDLTSTICNYPETTLGFLLLIVNFTGDLTGYLKDRKDMMSFFEGIGYQVHEVMNCTQQRMFEEIATFKQRILKSAINTNRIIVAVLSHGDVDGIISCADEDGVLKEMQGSKEVTTPVEDIIDQFKHEDKALIRFKCVPKFFIIQACHGQVTARAAGSGPACTPRSFIGDQSNPDRYYQPKVPVDADILVLSASTKYNKSFVGSQHKGSWLIQKMLAVFRQQHKTTEVERMLKAVTLSVSEQRSAMHYEDGTREVAVQVPSKQSTLRGDLYL